MECHSLRNEVLDAYLFEDLDQVWEITHEWLIEYNEQRPHDALGGLPPSLYKLKLETKNSILNCPVDGEAYGQFWPEILADYLPVWVFPLISI